MHNRPIVGIVFALLAATCYGQIPGLVRLASLNGISPLEATFSRTAVIAFVFALFIAATGRSIAVPRAAIVPLALQAFSTAILSVCYLASVAFIPVGLASIIFFCFPVIIALVSPIVDGTRVGAYRVGLALVAFGGLMLAIGPSFSSLDPRGIGLAALGAFGGTLQFFSGRQVARHMLPASVALWVHLLILPLTLAIALWFGDGHIGFFPGGPATTTGLVALAALGLIYVGGYFCHMSSVYNAPPAVVAPFFNLEPVVTIAVAALLVGERLEVNQYMGAALVLTALMMNALPQAIRRWYSSRQSRAAA